MEQLPIQLHKNFSDGDDTVCSKHWKDQNERCVHCELSEEKVDTVAHDTSLVIRDSATARTIRLELDPGESSLIISCYSGDRREGEPLAALQLACYEDQIEVLYWDAVMIDGDDPKRIVLVDVKRKQQ